MLSINTTYRRTLPDGSISLHTITNDTELKYHSSFAEKYPQVRYEAVDFDLPAVEVKKSSKPRIHIADNGCSACEA
jgi:hypothetical protein